jgi:hypothetical protein
MTPPPSHRSRGRYQLVPMSIKGADQFVAHHHSHSLPTGGKAKAAIGCERDGILIGVCVLGRPKGRHADTGRRLEVVRMCIAGDLGAEPHAASFLLGRARRLNVALGYGEPLVSYLRFDEDGTAYAAAGWVCTGHVKADDGNRPSRPRAPQYEIVPRTRWEDLADA